MFWVPEMTTAPSGTTGSSTSLGSSRGFKQASACSYSIQSQPNEEIADRSALQPTRSILASEGPHALTRETGPFLQHTSTGVLNNAVFASAKRRKAGTRSITEETVQREDHIQQCYHPAYPITLGPNVLFFHLASSGLSHRPLSAFSSHHGSFF